MVARHAKFECFPWIRLDTAHALLERSYAGLGRIWSFVMGFRSLVARLVPFERRETKPEGEKIFGNGKCELIANFSATIVTSQRRERREVWREKRKVRIFGKGSVSSSPILARQWWRHFRLSLSVSVCISFSLSLSLSLSLSHTHTPKVPNAQYRTGQNLIICLGFSITRRAARAIQERVGTKRANFLATESVIQRHNGETGSVKWETKSAI